MVRGACLAGRGALQQNTPVVDEPQFSLTKERSVNKIHLSVVTALVGCMAGIVVAARAADSEDIIKYRRAMMEANGGHLTAAAAIIRGKVDYRDQLADHVRALAAINKDIAALFPKDSDFGDTNALDAVWKKNDEFKKRARVAHDKADALKRTVDAKDTKNYEPRLKELIEACKSCHEDFRKEEK